MKNVEQYAKSKAARCGCEWLAEDIAQEIHLQWFLGRKATAAQIAIDVIRAEFGDKRRLGYELQKAERKAWVMLDPEAHVDFAAETEVTDGIQWKTILDSLEGDDRTIAALYFQWGLSLKEIGFCLGITEGRVCQMMTVIQAKIRKRKLVALEV